MTPTKSTQCNRCISAGGGDCATCTPESGEPNETISALISENARLGAELKRMTERAALLSGEHDAAIAKAERERVVKTISWWVSKHTFPQQSREHAPAVVSALELGVFMRTLGEL